MRRRYKLTDREWEVVQMFLPPVRKSQGGRPPKNRRQMLNAVLWVPVRVLLGVIYPIIMVLGPRSTAFSGAYKGRHLG